MWTMSKQSRQMALEHSQLESVILQRTSEVHNLSVRLLNVQDDERRKLSRDLHDSTGQTLAFGPLATGRSLGCDLLVKQNTSATVTFSSANDGVMKAIPTPDDLAISFRLVASPPRVGSRST